MNIVYKTTNLINGKQYVGSHYTKNIDDGYLGSGTILILAIKKHGKNNFKREVLEYCNDLIDARKLEEHYIQKHNTLLPNGYNISPCGGILIKGRLSEETKNKLSISCKIFWENLNDEEKLKLKFSTERKQKISESLKDKPKSDIHKKSLSKAWEKRKIEHPVSEETKKKRSDTSKGKINIKIYKVIDPNGVEYITTNGLTKFCEEHNLTVKLMNKVSTGKRKHHKKWKCELIH